MSRIAVGAGLVGLLLACGEERTATPDLVVSNPTAGATVPRTAWLSLTFAAPPDPASLEGFELRCNGEPHAFRVAAAKELVIVNPAGELPPSSGCELAWLGPAGDEVIAFSVAGIGAPAVVAYDRDDAALLAPFPDDILLTDANTPTGKVLTPPALNRPATVTSLMDSLFGSTAGVDGFSPLAPWVVDLPDALDPLSPPFTLEQSLDPLATVLMYDIDRESPNFGQRVPLYLVPKSYENAQGVLEHQLIIFPAYRLTPTGQYALIVTRRALVDPTRPLEASGFMRAALSANRTTDRQNAVGQIGDAVMSELAGIFPPLERDDIALVLRGSIRSMEHVADDLLAVREQLDSLPPPTFTIDEVVPDSRANSPVAAVVTGTWNAPRYGYGQFVNRVDGVPAPTGTEPITFTLALPGTPRAPIVMYQHGSPGSGTEAVDQARSHLAGAGFAVIGFTQALDRTTDGVNDQFLTIFSTLIMQSRFPDLIALQSNIEQLCFLRLISELADLDVLPLGAPDGTPDLDVTAPWSYLGISYGSHNGVGFLPFAPEIHAAALAVGGGRWGATLVHQDESNAGAGALYAFVTDFYPELRRSEFYVGLSLTQMGVDDQDWLNRAHLLYREPLGLGPAPSVLLSEGLNDTWIPPFSTETAAHELGIPQLAPVSPVPFLESVVAPLQGNVNGTATGALVQFVPSEAQGFSASPGCESEPEGHYCAPRADNAIAQRLRFFESALQGIPEIVAP